MLAHLDFRIFIFLRADLVELDIGQLLSRNPFIGGAQCSSMTPPPVEPKMIPAPPLASPMGESKLSSGNFQVESGLKDHPA